ncbi:MAG TPA: hypothetical protein VLE21_04780 [Candidatus Nitrosocosmicus sp.]|nr:hypothetical protein [Candidatus Nitrosocosmicus sp.]
MVYGIYLSLDQTKWAYGDYSSSNKLTFTIYSDVGLTAAFNLTGYTLKIRLFKSRWHTADYLNQDADIVTAASGTGSYTAAQGEMPGSGLYLVKVELAKSGEVMSTLNDVELMIVGGPTA